MIVAVPRDPADEGASGRTWRALVSPIGGVVQRIVQIPLLPTDPGVSMKQALVGNGPVWLRAPWGSSLDGLGVDTEETTAELKAVAEALEHYAASVFDESELTWASPASLAACSLDMNDLPQCSSFERSRSKDVPTSPSLTHPIRWVNGRCLSEDRPVWVPAVMSFLGISSRSPSEAFWIRTSVGCAVHTSPDAAILGGLLECIERDAVALWWLTRQPLPFINTNSSGDDLEVEDLLYEARRAKLRLRLLDATTDLGVPVVISICEGTDAHHVKTAVGAGASLDIRTAVRKAILESFQMQRVLRQAQRPRDAESIRRPVEGAAYMSGEESAQAFRFVADSPPPEPRNKGPIVERDSSRAQWEALVARLASAGFPTYMVDLTTDELRWADMTAVRVLVPNLQPAGVGCRVRFLQSRRLIDLCQAKRIKIPQDLNPFPMPLG
ncbi:MAG: YcaO-like family protein [Gammaproteobacteria bacterium]